MLRAFGLDLDVVEEKFRSLKDNVKLVLFSRETDCAHCNEIKTIMKQLASASNKVTFESYSYLDNLDSKNEYRIFAVPALAIIGAKDYGIRYYGCPKGNELYNFLDDIIKVSNGVSKLDPEIQNKLSSLGKPINLKIFISPNCPYSLPAAKFSLNLVIACDEISVDIIHADEFYDLAEKYYLRGIPLTVVNEKKSFYGALDEHEYVRKIFEFAG